MTDRTEFWSGVGAGVAMGFLLGLAVASKAHAADLIMPPPPNYRASDPRPHVDITQHKPELCMLAGVQPYPGQTLKVDRTCWSGLRWVYGE